MLRLRDIMTADVVTVGPQTTLREAVELFATRHIGGAPVVDGGKVVGVVSASDLIAFQASTPPVPAAGAEPAWDGSDESDAPPGWETGDDPAARFFTDEWADDSADVAERFAETASPEWDVLADHTVSEVMTRRLVALPPGVDAITGADRMRTAEVHRLLVIDEGRLLGIVTTLDFVRAVADDRFTRRTYVFER